MKKNQVQFSMFTMLVTFSLIPLVLSIALISAASLYITRNNLEKGVKDTLFVVANNLANHCKENEITAMNASGYYDYLDSLKEQNIEMAIIAPDMPCTTSIKNENDYRVREIAFETDIETDPQEVKSGYYDEHVEIDGRVYYGYYIPIQTEDETMSIAFAGQLQEKVMGDIKSVVMIFCGTAAFLIVLFMIVILVFSRNMAKSLASAERNIDALSKGILSRQKEHKSAVKEMHMLLCSTGLMQRNLSETIGKVKDVSTNLAESITDVTGLSSNCAEGAKQITSAMEQLSQAATLMDENVQNIHNKMSEIEVCVNDISGNVEHLYDSSRSSLQTNDEAKKSMDVLIENSKKSVEAVSDIAAQIRQTNASITEIDKAVELILQISDQTSLLSLNATIEAARAGEQGKGFAVVAEEIRALASQSAQGAEMIKNLAQTISKKSEKSVQLADGLHGLIAVEQENVAATQDKIDRHSEDINQSVVQIKSIAQKTEKLTKNKEVVVESVTELSVISEENSASNEEVSGNITKIMEQVQSVSENCEKMNEMAQELNASVMYFHN